MLNLMLSAGVGGIAILTYLAGLEGFSILMALAAFSLASDRR